MSERESVGVGILRESGRDVSGGWIPGGPEKKEEDGGQTEAKD
jgi:hypothetical protein